MLQYILTESPRYSVAELCQMAIEGGCGWISLRLPEMTDDEVRAAIEPDVIEMCRQAGIFLTVDDRPELARELGLHGVRFTVGSPAAQAASPAQLRDELGPEAVIGIVCADPSAAPAMVAADIDYICTPASFDSDRRREFIAAVRALDVAIPIVAQGDISADNAADYLAEGSNGLAVGRNITDAPDPVEAVAAIIAAISC